MDVLQVYFDSNEYIDVVQRKPVVYTELPAAFTEATSYAARVHKFITAAGAPVTLPFKTWTRASTWLKSRPESSLETTYATFGEVKRAVLLHNLRTADRYYLLSDFNIALTQLLDKDPEWNTWTGQDVERWLRAHDFETHLFAYPLVDLADKCANLNRTAAAAHQNTTFRFRIFAGRRCDAVGPHGEASVFDVEPRYELRISCRPRPAALAEVLHHWPSYDVNFAQLPYCAALISRSTLEGATSPIESADLTGTVDSKEGETSIAADDDKVPSSEVLMRSLQSLIQKTAHETFVPTISRILVDNVLVDQFASAPSKVKSTIPTEDLMSSQSTSSTTSTETFESTVDAVAPAVLQIQDLDVAAYYRATRDMLHARYADADILFMPIARIVFTTAKQSDLQSLTPLKDHILQQFTVYTFVKCDANLAPHKYALACKYGFILPEEHSLNAHDEHPQDLVPLAAVPLQSINVRSAFRSETYM